MKKKESSFESNTGMGKIHYEIWVPEDKPAAVIQIAHGMAEHIGRYRDFAEYLNENGFAVIMNDHAGHGKSIRNEKNKGHFGNKNGWTNVIKDMKVLHDLAVNEFPDVPMILMGHSMGSFLSRLYAVLYPKDYIIYIFSGTAGKNNLLGFGKLVAITARRLKGALKTNALLQWLSVGSNNKRIKNAELNAWLTSEKDIVAVYNEDPLCGFALTPEAMLDLIRGMEAVTGIKWARKVPDVPIYILYGEQDPVGNYGKGPSQVKTWLEETGHHDIECKAYQEGRHEMLNESNRMEVYKNLVEFLKRKTWDIKKEEL